MLSGAPRLALFLTWLFTDKLTIALSSFWVGFLGFLVLPFTTVMYAWAYAPVRGVNGIGWFFVALGVVLDISSYTSGGAYRRRQSSAAY